MGGYGSGRWGASRRALAETMRRIDLTQLRCEEPSLTHRHALKSHCQRDDGETVQVATIYLESTKKWEVEIARRYGKRRRLRVGSG